MTNDRSVLVDYSLFFGDCKHKNVNNDFTGWLVIILLSSNDDDDDDNDNDDDDNDDVMQ